MSHNPQLIAEAERVLGICNACRYCEGLCPVFPALAQRRSVIVSDMVYLADLCHRCGACYDVCQYADPHPFNVQVPKLMADLREESYASFARPRWLARVLKHNLRAFVLLSGLFLLVGVLWLLGQQGVGGLTQRQADGNFYAVVSHQVMVTLGLLTFGLGLGGFAASIRAYARAIELRWSDVLNLGRWHYAISQAASLRVLSDAQGCQSLGSSQARERRIAHHFMAYGLLFCFAATSVATIYHFALSYPAPYPILSLPVGLGIVGGVGLILGPGYLLWLKGRPSVALATVATDEQLNRALLWVLIGVSASGLALLALRGTGALPLLLLVHLALVYSLFLLAPFSKLIHGPYRFLALLKRSGELPVAKIPVNQAN